MPVIIDGTLGVQAAAVTTTSWNPTNLVIPGNATIGDASSDTLTINGASVTFAGTATRIKADFSNDTVANQAFFQTTGTNYSTQLRAIPNGTGTQSGFFFYGSSDIDNNSWGAIRTIAGNDVRIQSHTTGSGTLLPITFMTGTSERMRIAIDGKVGINTSTPETSLQVNGGLTLGTTGSTGTVIRFGTDGANGAIIRADRSDASGVRYLAFGLDYNERMRIHTDGNVGIGTNAPVQRLHVHDHTIKITSAFTGATATDGLNIDVRSDNGDVAFTNYENTNMLFYTNALERVRVANDGNVLIGTSSQLNGFTNRLVISGAITAGTDTATAGSTMLQNRYGNGSTANIGADASSGGLVLGYCVTPKSGVPVAFTSATTFGSAAPSAYVVRDYHMWLTSPVNQNLATIGPDVNLTSAMVIAQSGKVSIGSGHASPTSTLDVIGLQANTGSTAANLPTGTLRLGFDGGATPGVYGSSLVFTQRWYSPLATQVAVGQITGVKVTGDGNFGGGLAFFTSDGVLNNLAERMRIDHAGKVNIGAGAVTTPSRLYVQGAVTVSTLDPSITQTFVGMSQTNSGTIHATTSCSGTMTTGDTFYLKYEASTWKSFSFELDIASTNGYARIIGGGYCNGSVSGGMNKIYEYGSVVQSYTLEANPSNNQAVWVKLVLFGQTHPHITVRFSTSGGEGAPDASKLSFTWNS